VSRGTGHGSTRSLQGIAVRYNTRVNKPANNDEKLIAPV
jgi:hypothetical protein